jgi:hypothetical protein
MQNLWQHSDSRLQQRSRATQQKKIIIRDIHSVGVKAAVSSDTCMCSPADRPQDPLQCLRCPLPAQPIQKQEPEACDRGAAPSLTAHPCPHVQVPAHHTFTHTPHSLQQRHGGSWGQARGRRPWWWGWHGGKAAVGHEPGRVLP